MQIAGEPLAVELEDLVRSVFDDLHERGRIVDVAQQADAGVAQGFIDRNGRLERGEKLARIGHRRANPHMQATLHVRGIAHGAFSLAGASALSVNVPPR